MFGDYYYDLPVCNRSSQHSGIHTLGNFTQRETKVDSVKMSTITVSDQETKQSIKLIDKSANKNINMLNITDLVSCSSQFVCLPEKIAQLPNELSELEINNEEFPEFPELLYVLKNLNKLQIQNNMLKSVPERIGKLQNLVTLNLSHNMLTELPDNLSDLQNLEVLNLSHNQLQTLPNSYSKLRKLKNLDLSSNKLKAIPKCVRDGMITLKVLDISQNESVKTNIIPCTKYLEKFYARNNGNCNKFPDWVVTPKFFNLTEVDLSKTNYTIYSFVYKDGDVNVKSLSMTCSNLSNTVLAMMIENMVSLEKLNVSNEEDPTSSTGNVFNEIPVQILKNPLAITELNFRGTALPSVTPEIKQLINLKKLNVGLNCILWLPEEICCLEKLECLIADGNSMFTLPDRIGNLKSLKELNVSGNALVHLPTSFANLSNLQLADFYNNKIEEFPSVLSKMTNLQSLDLEKNYFFTNNIKIGEKSYSELYDAYVAYRKEDSNDAYNSRLKGAKKSETVKSDDSKESYWCHGYSDKSDEETSVKSVNFKNDSDDNWETAYNTDDEFDPEDPRIAYDKGKRKEYMYQKPQGFCPEDLHLKRIKAEVVSMKAYGSLPSYQIEPGQFDDAE